MIELTKLNENKIILNADLIETVEETPDTVIRTQKAAMRQRQNWSVENRNCTPMMKPVTARTDS